MLNREGLSESRRLELDLSSFTSRGKEQIRGNLYCGSLGWMSGTVGENVFEV